MKKIYLSVLALSVVFFLMLSCDKKEVAGEKEEESKTEELEQKSRAEFNNKQMPGVANVFISDFPKVGDKQQLYTKADYRTGHLAYYISPVSGDDIGTDHRIVFSANKGDQCVVEMDEKEQLIRLYTQREGKRLPILLQVKQHALKEFELRLYRIDWDKKVEELVGSVYLRNGEAVGAYLSAARAASTQQKAAAKDTLGFYGIKRPRGQTSKAAVTGAFFVYISQVLDPIVDTSNKGMGTLSSNLEKTSVLADAFGFLWYDLGTLTTVLGDVGAVFPAFRTDPLSTSDPLKRFQWYDGQGALAVNIKDLQLSAITKSSVLIYDETALNIPIKLVVQVEDKNKKPLIGNPVFVDFRVELEQDGKNNILSQQTLSTDKANGMVEMLLNAQQIAVKPKAGSVLTIFYRLSAHEGATFTKQQVIIADQQPAHIILVSGNGQEVDWEEKMKAPLVVKVTNKAGQVLKNVRVKWKVQSVSWGIIVGILSDTQELTDANGTAKTYYTVGKQQEKPETVLVQALGTDGQPLPQVSATFTYKQKRRNFTLVQLKFEVDRTDMSKTSVIREWKSGDQVTIMENELIPFNIKENGVLLRLPDGSPAHFIHSTKGIVQTSKYANRTFQSKDIILNNWGVTFSDPLTGRMDSVVINLTVSNQLYRTFVGKTVRVEGGGNPVHGNIGEVLTFAYRSDGKVEIKSKTYPTNNVITTFATNHMDTYAPIYGCSDKNGVMPYTMKRVVGVITSPAAPPMVYGMSATFLLFTDGTVRPNTLGIGFDACTFNEYWSSVKLQ